MEWLLSIITWIITPEKVVGLFKRVFFHKKVNRDDIINKLSELRLNIKNDISLKNETFIQGRSCVYFPVVPRADLSIIHLVFVYAIKGLTELGLKVKIFVFDDYYRRVKKADRTSCKIDVRNFVTQLKKLGIKGSDIKLESHYVKKSVFTKKIFNRISELCSVLTIDEVNALRKSTSAYNKRKDPYIRQHKIFYNLAYASLFDNVGFVLCGADEVPLWEKFVHLENGRTALSKLVILYIPSAKEDKCTWEEENYSTSKTREEIAAQLKNTLEKELIQRDCGVFYLLDNLYFARGKTIDYLDDRSVSIKDVDTLISEINRHVDEAGKRNMPDELFNNMVDSICWVLQMLKKRTKKEKKK